MRSGRLAAGLAVVALCGSAPASAAGPAADGRAIYQQDCASCHTIGGGVRVGPDLKDVTKRSSPAWVRAFIAAPDKVIAAGDPTASALVEQFHGIQMPNLGLSTAQVAAVVAYLESRSSAAPPSAGPSPGRPAKVGNVDTGKNDFTGATRLANGGPPCLSCHTIAGIGSLGGGTLGPDLTGAYDKYGGAAGIAGVLAGLPFPTMKPIFADHPLTAQEQAHLAAFLQAASTAQRPSDSLWKLVLLGLGAALLCLALAFVIWPRRYLAVRRRIAPTYTPTRKG